MKRFTVKFASALFLLLVSTLAWCDQSVLRPPKGSKVAIVVFEDLECPQCARVAPLLHDASKKYDVPLIQHDFPLKQHPWSFEAAVNARFFDSKSPKLGEDYRLYIFQNQIFVTKQNLQGMTEKWAEQHGVAFPFVVDPNGELTKKVEADRALGNQIPLDHTPTIYIVTDTPKTAPVTEVKDPTQLYQMLDDITKQAKLASPSSSKATATSAAAKKNSKSTASKSQ
jgi:protein-disulfide isomerase